MRVSDLDWGYISHVAPHRGFQLQMIQLIINVNILTTFKIRYGRGVKLNLLPKIDDKKSCRIINDIPGFEAITKRHSLCDDLAL